MRVLGIDPGYAIVGWGVVEYIGNRFAPIGYGAVITEKTRLFEQRLVEIYEGVLDISKRYQPEALYRKAVLPAQPDHRHRRG